MVWHVTEEGCEEATHFSHCSKVGPLQIFKPSAPKLESGRHLAKFISPLTPFISAEVSPKRGFAKALVGRKIWARFDGGIWLEGVVMKQILLVQLPGFVIQFRDFCVKMCVKWYDTQQGLERGVHTGCCAEDGPIQCFAPPPQLMPVSSDARKTMKIDPVLAASSLSPSPFVKSFRQITSTKRSNMKRLAGRKLWMQFDDMQW